MTVANSGRGLLVPLAGIEPALLAELDFESSASTSSATGAFRKSWPKGTGACEAADYSRQRRPVNPRGCDFPLLDNARAHGYTLRHRRRDESDVRDISHPANVAQRRQSGAVSRACDP